MLGPGLIDDQNMQTLRPMRTEQKGLFNIRAAGRPGDPVDGPGQLAGAGRLTDTFPDRLVIPGNVIRLHDDDVIQGQKIQGCRGFRAG